MFIINAKFLTPDIYEKETKWSHHRYLHYDLIYNYSTLEKNICLNNNLNEKDLYGKYCSLNFLLDIFTNYQNGKMRYFFNQVGDKRDPKIDFLYTSYLLYKNGATGNISDYKYKTFEENIFFYLNRNSNTFKEFDFIDKNYFDFINATDSEKKDLVINHMKQDHNYLYYYLELTEPKRLNSNKNKI